MGAPKRTGQVYRLESRREAESTRHQDGHRVRHFVSRRGHWHWGWCGTARLQGNYTDRLPVVRRYVYGAICGVPSLQEWTGSRHQPGDDDAECDGEVLMLA